MDAVNGELLAFGVAAGLSPIPIVASIVVMTSRRAGRNGLALLVGWLAGILLVGGVVLLLAAGATGDSNEQETTVGAAVRLVVGGAMLILAGKQFLTRPHAGETAEIPGWIEAIDGFTAWRSGLLGAALSAANPKNLVLVLGAAGTIASSGAPASAQVVAFLIFTTIATVGVALPLLLRAVIGDRATGLLAALKNRLIAHNAAIMTVVLAVIGLILIRDGLAGLS